MGFPGSPVVGTWPSSTGGADLIPGWGAWILHVAAKGPRHEVEAML